MSTRLSRLRLKKIDLVDRGAAVGARVTLAKRRDVAKEHTMTLEEALAKLPDDVKAVIMSALEAAAQKAAPPPAPPAEDEKKKEEEALKLLPESLRKRFEANALAVEKVAKMEEENLTREYVAKAAKLPAIAGLDVNDLGAVLKALDCGRVLSKELCVKLTKSLESMNELISKSAVLGSTGSSGANSNDDPRSRIEGIAKSLREKDASLTTAQAFALACKQNPALYAEHRQASRS